jgi:hypothetical protein
MVLIMAIFKNIFTQNNVSVTHDYKVEGFVGVPLWVRLSATSPRYAPGFSLLSFTQKHYKPIDIPASKRHY